MYVSAYKGVSCESMVHRPPGSRVCSERPGGELRRETLKTKATGISRSACEVYVFSTNTTLSVEDANALLESVGNASHDMHSMRF